MYANNSLSEKAMLHSLPTYGILKKSIFNTLRHQINELTWVKTLNTPKDEEMT